MSVLIKHMAMPKGCIYANDKDQTEYCPLLNHDDVPFCQYIETEPEIAIGIDERPVYCPLFDVSESCQDTVSRAAAVDALDEIESEIANGYGYQYPKWRKYFCELPSAQPEPLQVARDIATIIENEQDMMVIERNAQQWIPCSERLPEDYTDVLVWFEYFRYGDYNRLYQTYGIGDYSSEYDSWMINHESGWNKLRVIAWMPLPKPYKEEQE